MRFSSLLSHLSAVDAANPRHLASDPEISGAQAIDLAAEGQLCFLESGSPLSAALGETGSSAVLLPLDESLQHQATERGLAWVAVADPRLAFAEALDALHPRPRPQPGIHPTAVIDPSARIGAGVHVGPHAVVGAGTVVGEGCILHAAAVLYEAYCRVADAVSDAASGYGGAAGAAELIAPKQQCAVLLDLN